jgi:hypothetical protein
VSQSVPSTIETQGEYGYGQGRSLLRPRISTDIKYIRSQGLKLGKAAAAAS